MKNRNQSDINGVLLVDKERGMTSHDAVAIARRSLGIRKIGHCGTLDPLATGLLILVIGRGTKVQDLLMSEDKIYEGTLLLGVTTDSQDADGEVIAESEVRDFGEAEIEAVFGRYHGDFYQTPPMVSAIKKEGVPLYKLARKGQTVEREPRLVHVYTHSVLARRLPEIDFRVKCSKGFYVRTYVHDIGQELGCGAHLKQLRRTQSGNFTLERAVTVDELKSLPRQELASRVLSLPEVSRLRGV